MVQLVRAAMRLFFLAASPAHALLPHAQAKSTKLMLMARFLPSLPRT